MDLLWVGDQPDLQIEFQDRQGYIEKLSVEKQNDNNKTKYLKLHFTITYLIIYWEFFKNNVLLVVRT